MSKTYGRPVRLRLKSSTLRSQLEQRRQEQQATEGRVGNSEVSGVQRVKVKRHIEHESSVSTAVLQERQRRQIKELLRLSNLMQAGLELDEVLRHIVASIASCTGFRISIICLLEGSNGHLVPVAFAGLSEEDERLLQEHPLTKAQMYRMMHPQFRISQSYFIPHQRFESEFADVFSVIPMHSTESEQEEGQWHPEDTFFVPLISPREQHVLGYLSLDDPEDGKIPTLERAEMVELFANQAAIAIDNARIFQERERDRAMLEQGIVALREDIEQIRHGDLYVHLRSLHPQLEPLGEALNENVLVMRSLVSDMWKVTQAVNDHARNVQHNSTMLVRDMAQQEQLVQRLSQVVETITARMQQISTNAASLLPMTDDAREVTQVGQESVDRSMEGMSKVRETMMQTMRSAKRLSESGQQMNDTMSGVSDMSARLHLISLNAAIEAARAGEQGQGFAVVAQELRGLSLTCSEASRKIMDYIRAIQQETTIASQHIEQNTQQVVMQTELVAQTSVSLDAIYTVTEGMASLIQNISTTADYQVEGSNHVSLAVRETLQTAGKVKTLMEETSESMAHLVELSNSLRSRIGQLHMGE